MAGDTGMAGKVALLLWAQTLGLAGATQLLVEPPWLPAVLWDRVTLTCRGSGTDGDTFWSKDRLPWWQEGRDSLTVTESGTYWCYRHGSGVSDPVRVLNDSLVLQVPAGPLLEGDTVTLRCRRRRDLRLNSVSFYRGNWEELGTLHNDTELSLPPLQLQHSGRYRCHGRVGISHLLFSVPVPVRVQELFSVPLLEGPPELAEGSPLSLSCLSTPSPLRPPARLLYRFYRDGQLVGGPQGSPQLLVPAVGVSHSRNYTCEMRSEGGNVRKSSARLGVTVREPVANATITPGPPALQVRPGDPVTLRCSVQVGSAPVTFTWLHDGHEVARGPVLELGDIDVGHSGTYQCVATNQLGQDGHRVFRALSPGLALQVTPRSPWITAVTAGIGGSLLFLVLLVAGAVGWHRRNNRAARKQQERPPPEPPAPPEEGEVLYTHVVSTKQAGVSPSATTLQDPQMTYAELAATHGRPKKTENICGNVL